MNPHAARPTRTLAILAFAAAMAACASVDPNAPPDVPAGAVEATRTDSNGDVVTEYRVNGAVAMVRIVPRQGPTYYLVDGDGRIDRTPHGTRDAPVYYKLYEW